MAKDTAIRVENVSKKFSRRLHEVMVYGATDIARNTVGLSSRPEILRNGEFWAVDDVSFELKQGETIGLIGANGSGKSTMLKMLNGIFMPDKGRIEINGRVGALIEVGAGFHPMLTGRENVYVNGSIMGMSKAEIDRKFTDIVDFANIGDFIDVPVKHYSSGMFVRLGFAVAVHTNPDILLVDEVLAVGDFQFQSACFGMINKLKREGTSIVLVTHDLRKMQMYCKEAVLLKAGKCLFHGNSADAIASYLESNSDEHPAEVESRQRAGNEFFGPRHHDKNKIKNVKYEWVDSNGQVVTKVALGQALSFRFSFELLDGAEELVIGIPFYSLDGTYMTGVSTDADRIAIDSRNHKVFGTLEIKNLCFNPGRYVACFSIADRNEFLFRTDMEPLEVVSNAICHGLVSVDHQWRFEQEIKC